jgi:hypothetical protein
MRPTAYRRREAVSGLASEVRCGSPPVLAFLGSVSVTTALPGLPDDTAGIACRVAGWLDNRIGVAHSSSITDSPWRAGNTVRRSRASRIRKAPDQVAAAIHNSMGCTVGAMDARRRASAAAGGGNAGGEPGSGQDPRHSACRASRKKPGDYGQCKAKQHLVAVPCSADCGGMPGSKHEPEGNRDERI